MKNFLYFEHCGRNWKFFAKEDVKSKQCFFLLMWVSLDKCFWNTLSSPCLCSSIKFCLPDKIINFTGLVDGQENEEKYKSILIANQSKYLDSEVKFCQLWGESPEEGNRGRQDEQDSSYPRSARASLVAPITHFSSYNLLLLIWR